MAQPSPCVSRGVVFFKRLELSPARIEAPPSVVKRGNTRYCRGMPPNKTAAEILRELREAQGGSLRSAARHLQLAPSYLSRLESGERQVPASLEGKLAHYYGTSVDLICLAEGRVPADIIDILRQHPRELDELREKYQDQLDRPAP